MAKQQPKHIVAITALIKDQSGKKLLLLKRSKDEVAYPNKWAFPGGKLESGQDIMETLKREVKEEAGLEIEEHKKFLKDYTFVRPDGHNVVGMTFEVKAKTTKIKISEDFTEYKWVTPEQMKELDHIPGMEQEVVIAFN